MIRNVHHREGRNTRYPPQTLLLMFSLCACFSMAGLFGVTRVVSTLHLAENKICDAKHSFDTMTYSDLVQLIAETYFSQSTSIINKELQFGYALEAMQLMETDGEPTQIEGYPFLYVGGVGAAYNLNALRREGITHIINLSGSALSKFYGRFTYLNFNSIHDDGSEDDIISPYFETISEFIENARSHGGKVYVHCWAGKRRSVTVLIAYLMKHHNMNRDEALSLIRINRPEAKPSENYWKELKDYRKALRENKKVKS